MSSRHYKMNEGHRKEVPHLSASTHEAAVTDTRANHQTSVDKRENAHRGRMSTACACFGCNSPGGTLKPQTTGVQLTREKSHQTQSRTQVQRPETHTAHNVNCHTAAFSESNFKETKITCWPPHSSEMKRNRSATNLPNLPTSWKHIRLKRDTTQHCPWSPSCLQTHSACDVILHKHFWFGRGSN